jgi:hypothetical protein
MNLFVKPSYLLDAPHAWYKGFLDRQALQDQALRLIQTDNFQSKCRYFAQAKLDVFTSHWALDRVMRDDSRFAMLSFMLYLHHHAAQTGGITYTGLKNLFEHGEHLPTGILASSTRIKALLNIARITGHLVPGSSRETMRGTMDRRTKTWAPTQKLIEPSTAWLQACIGGLQGALPLAATAEELMATPGLLAEVLSYNVKAYLHDDFLLYESFDSVRRLMQRDGGYLVLMQLLLTTRQDSATGRWHADAQPHALSKRFRVSSGTLRNALKDCVDSGWLVQAAPGGSDWLVKDDFVQQCQRWAAYEMLWMAGNVNAAFTRLRSNRDAG